jgi:hypothetical protein
MAETDRHRKNMVALMLTLDHHFAADPLFYVSGNLFVYYARGDRLKHLSPDVFVVRGVPRGDRDYYLVWEEGKGPELVIELTSRSTREEDLDDKFALYRDMLKVREYFLFDPRDEYLKPPLQGFQLRRGRYVPIPKVKGRLPSEVVDLHLEKRGWELRLFDPSTRKILLAPWEREDLLEKERRKSELARRRAEAEIERLRKELESMRRRPSAES